MLKVTPQELGVELIGDFGLAQVVGVRAPPNESLNQVWTPQLL